MTATALDGVLVLDLTSAVTGGFAGKLLELFLFLCLQTDRGIDGRFRFAAGLVCFR